MGGGDLNSKKSWHPNTMKNQERVWKAEQAAADEKKRIVELQRERDVERDRTELNNIMKNNCGITTDDNRLHWMYDKPDKKVKDEDFLLGKAIGKDAEQLEKSESDSIPALSRRVVGSSMLTGGGDSQVDIARKIREDPLLLIKERERAARAALLNNPLQRKRLTELLRKEQMEKKDSKNKKKDKDLDNMLAAKLNSLGGGKGIDLATLLDSDNSSSSSSLNEKPKKKKKKHKKEKNKKKSKKSRKRTRSSSSDSVKGLDKSDKSRRDSKEIKETHSHRKCSSTAENRKRKSDDNSCDNYNEAKKGKLSASSGKHHDRKTVSESHPDSAKTDSFNKKPTMQSNYHSRRKRGLTDEEIQRRLADMASAGVEREVERSRRVANQREADEAVEVRPKQYSARNEARVLPDSLESRIHSNRHNIQRNRKHMSEHFARR